MEPENVEGEQDNTPESNGDPNQESRPVIATAEALVGTKLDQYLIIQEIGRGSMGIVFEAFETVNNQKVALKILPPNLNLSDKIIRRFLREAESVAKLSHANIVKIHGIGHTKSVYYYAMELLQGIPLDKMLERDHPISFKKLARLLLQTCEGVHFAHEHQIIHRDIKPGNLIVVDNDTIVITDFGLARPEKAATLTESGALVGTPIYMSPEQVMAKRGGVDKRTDIYSLGVTLYQLLSGVPPFRGKSTQKILSQIMQDDPKPPHRRLLKVPRALSIITMKAMEKDPNHRFQSAKEMAEELERYLSGASIKSKPAGLVTRISKRVRRHKVISALGTLTLILTTALFIHLITSSSKIEKTQHSLDTIKEEHEKDKKYNENVKLARELLSGPGAGINLTTTFSLINETIRIHPERPEAHICMGKCYTLQKKADMALKEFCMAVSYGPASSEARLERGLFYVKKGSQLKLDNAIFEGLKDLYVAMELDAENPIIKYHFANTLYNCSNAEDLGFQERRDLIGRAFRYAQNAKAFGSNADIECLLARIYVNFAKSATSRDEMMSHLNSAGECLVSAKNMDKNHLLAYQLDEDVKKMMERPGPVNETNPSEIIESQGVDSVISSAANTYQKLRKGIEDTLSDTEEQRKIFESIMSVLSNPQPTVGVIAETLKAASGSGQEEGYVYDELLDMAAECLDKGLFENAVTYYEKALVQNPAKAPELNFYIAEAYFTFGEKEDYSKSLHHARLAYAQDPKNGAYLQILAQILLEKGDDQGFKELCTEAKKNGTIYLLGMELPFIKEGKKETVPF